MDKKIILDLGRVVFIYDPLLSYKAFNLNETKYPFESIYNELTQNELYLDFEKGLVSDSNFQKFLENAIEKSLSVDEFNKAWNASLPDFLPGVPELLDNYTKKCDFYALSNTNKIHLKHLRSFPLANRIKKIFASNELHIRKPDPEIFKLVLQELNVTTPKNILYVDDLHENVQAALSLGINAKYCENSTPRLKSLIEDFLEE